MPCLKLPALILVFLTLVLSDQEVARKPESLEDVKWDDLPMDMPREEKIWVLKEELEERRVLEMEPAQEEVRRSEILLTTTRGEMPWWGATEEQNEKLERAKLREQEAHKKYSEAVARVEEVNRRIKPLYGLVSTEHYMEHRLRIAESFSFMGEAAYHNAVWETLFSAARAESLSELVMMFIGRIVMGIAFFYPFAFLWYMWFSFWTIYAYWDGGFLTLFGLSGLYVVSLVVFLLPAILLFGGCLGVVTLKKREQEATIRRNENYRRIIHSRE